ncbi:MAG: hypothetical protein IPI49_19595 [Myxococcales bacterium]|nr:hypothetical protein [Myxococcales bacterium]
MSQPLSPFDRQEDPALVARMTALAAMSAPPTDASSPAPAVAVVGKRRPAGAKRASLPVISGAPTDTAEQLDLCWPARRLWEDGVQDRSVGIFLLVRYLAYKGLSLERLTELVLAFDRRVLGKLERRDGAEYVRHAWEKVRATRRPDGTIAPPCHALQKLGLCPVNRDARARCDDYNLLFDLGAAVDGLPRSPFQAARKLLPVLEVLAHKDAPTQAKHLKVLAWHCSIHKPVLRRWLLRVMQAVPAVEESTADL